MRFPLPGKEEAKYLIIPFLLLLVFAFTKNAIAQSKIISPNYEIQLPNFNSGAGIPSSSSFKLDSTIGQTGPGLYTSSGYLVKSGFQYIHSIIPFSFQISSVKIDFGTLTSGTPVTRNNIITVSAGGAGGYNVYVQENHPLKNYIGSSSFIPDTLCDTGNCSESQARLWTQNSTFGFGFNINGDDKATDFTNTDYFRQFADSSISETGQIIMGSTNVGRSRTATVTYKVNVSSMQPSGTYSGIIQFTAVPLY